MNFSHVRIALVLSWERTFFAGEPFAASAARDHAPELRRWLVDRVVVTTQVGLPRESRRAAWPVAADLPKLSALLAAAG